MKTSIFLVLALTSVYAHSQQIPVQVQAKRGVFTERLFVNGQWIDSITTNLDGVGSASDNVLATAKAISDYIKTKAGNSIQDQFSIAQPASIWLRGAATIGSHNSYNNLLVSGAAQVNVTHANAQHGLSIQRSTAYPGPASLVFFKNNGDDFNTLHALEAGDAVGRLVFSGAANNTSNTLKAMDIQGLVEKVGPQHLSGGFVFNTTDTSGNYGRRIWLNGEGNLLIGNATENPYRLNVAEGNVRFESLAGSGNVLVGSNNDGVLYKIKPGEGLNIKDGFLYANIPAKIDTIRKYYAVITQSGQDTLIANAWENTVGEIIWTRTNEGYYTGTVMGSINEIRLFNAEASDVAGNKLSISLYSSDENTVTLNVTNSAGFNTDAWTTISIEIRGWNTN